MTDFFNDENISKINNLLKQSSDSILCDTTCQTNRRLEQLKQDYLNAKNNLLTAPQNIEIAEKNLYTFIGGDTLYNEELEKQLNSKVKEEENKYNSIFNTEKEKTQNMMKEYSVILKNTENTYELYDKYITKINEIKKNINKKKSDIFTNDRKIYYEITETDNQIKYYYFLLFFYFVLGIIYSFLMFKLSTYHFNKKIFIILIVIFYPFFIYYIVFIISKILSTIYSNFPKNIYLNKL